MVDMQAVLLLILVIGGAGYDIAQRRVPNWLTVSIALAGLAANGYAGGLAGLGSAALGALVGMGILLIPFALGTVGAGDVKFLGAAGAVTGPVFVANGAILGFLWGGLLAVFVLLARGRIRATVAGMLLRFVAWMAGARGRGNAQPVEPAIKARGDAMTVPYAVALALGLVSAWAMETLHGSLMLQI